MAEACRSRPWSPHDSAELYLVNHWGRPFFSVNDAGHMAFTPHGAQGPSIDFLHLLEDLRARGVHAPVLLRFNDILGRRVHALADAFRQAMQRHDYPARYTGVMPIKVNQQRHVVEELCRHGESVGLGLEAGSKPELMAAMALLGRKAAPIVCNGYKDREYVDTALLAQKLGPTPYLVLDRFDELALVIEASRASGLRPAIGLRARLQARGSGRWAESSGEKSKFGLSAREMVAAIAELRANGLLDCVRLLHFHIGSQVTTIKSVKEAVREAAFLYVGLREQGATELDTIDCGGGLAVDYDGSQTDFHASKNYSTQEYANDVVGILADTCRERGHPLPHLISESGRSLVAQHSVLVFNVLGVHRFHDPKQQPAAPRAGDHDIVRRMWAAYEKVDTSNFQAAYNDIVELKEESALLFAHGVIDLNTRAQAEALVWATCERVLAATERADFVPDDLRSLAKELADTYYCNFSIFQSLPDAWAVGHLFPIVPLHRLDEEPSRHASLADLTCDSDGKIDRFIDLRDVKETLRLHPPNGQPYYLGAFLVGAYQEILGDLHNLFGDTNAVHVSLSEDGTYTLDHLVEGDSVGDVLGYVQYQRQHLEGRVVAAAQAREAEGHLQAAEVAELCQHYRQGLAGYTYLGD